MRNQRWAKPLCSASIAHLVVGFLVFPAVILLAVHASGCAGVGYYTQAVAGHLTIIRNRQPVAQLLAAQETDPQLRERLALILQAREFASRELLLPDNNSYRSYVDTGRRFAVWNVVATPEFSLKPKKWCFPVAGCVSYRGYFSSQAAQRYARKLRAQRFDVAVVGTAAYSTLGWFDDPVLNTMLYWRDSRLVGLIFHELAHQQLYVKDDSTFNEGFAVTVEQEGVNRWLQRYGDIEQREAYQLHRKRKAQFLALLQETRIELETLYGTNMLPVNKRRRKAEVFTILHQRYAALKQTWDGYLGYEAWFRRELNNARLTSVATYNDLVPAFRRLLDESGGNLKEFYREVEKLARLPTTKRAARMRSLISAVRPDHGGRSA